MDELVHQTHERRHGSFKIWNYPEPKKKYFVGVDTAEGVIRDRQQFKRTQIGSLNQRPDFSAAVVVERETGDHVATWHGDIPVTEWGYVCAAIGLYYNQAMIVVEVNGPGIEVINTLAKRVRYPRLYRDRQQEVVMGDDFLPRWGWRTTVTSRPRLLARVEETIAENRYATQDHDMVREFRTMEIDESGKARARHPNHDDRVFALGLALVARAESLQGRLFEDHDKAPMSDLPAYDQEVWRRRNEHCDRAEATKNGTGGWNYRGVGTRSIFSRASNSRTKRG